MVVGVAVDISSPSDGTKRAAWNAFLLFSLAGYLADVSRLALLLRLGLASSLSLFRRRRSAEWTRLAFVFWTSLAALHLLSSGRSHVAPAMIHFFAADRVPSSPLVLLAFDLLLLLFLRAYFIPLLAAAP